MVDQDGLYLFYNGAASSLFWSSNDSPLPLISNTEVRFLEARLKAEISLDSSLPDSLFSFKQGSAYLVENDKVLLVVLLNIEL